MKYKNLLLLSVLLSATLQAKYPYESICQKSGGAGGKVFKEDKNQGDWWSDKWSLAQCNCTSFVGYSLNRDGLAFSNSYGKAPGNWSSAFNWSARAKTLGIKTDESPMIGSVAQWEKNENGVGKSGHVAYVDKVNYKKDGSIESIVISEYNYIPSYSYSSRTLKPGTKNYPGRFIHFEDINSEDNSDDTNETDTEHSDDSEKRAFFYNGLAWIGSYDCYDQNNKFFEAEKRDGGVFLKKRLFKDMSFNTKALCDSYEVPRECTAEKPIDEFDDGKE